MDWERVSIQRQKRVKSCVTAEPQLASTSQTRKMESRLHHQSGYDGTGKESMANSVASGDRGDQPRSNDVKAPLKSTSRTSPEIKASQPISNTFPTLNSNMPNRVPEPEDNSISSNTVAAKSASKPAGLPTEQSQPETAPVTPAANPSTLQKVMSWKQGGSAQGDPIQIRQNQTATERSLNPKRTQTWQAWLAGGPVDNTNQLSIRNLAKLDKKMGTPQELNASNKAKSEPVANDENPAGFIAQVWESWDTIPAYEATDLTESTKKLLFGGNLTTHLDRVTTLSSITVRMVK